jgi:hypothetical protein
VRYGLPTIHEPAPRPGRDEDATQPSVLVIGSEHAFAHWVGGKQMTPVLGVPLRQCAWCGLILTGRWQDTTVLHLTEEGPRPYLLPGYSHGLCEDCRDTIYLQWRRSRATKVIKQRCHRDEVRNENAMRKLLFTARTEEGEGTSYPETTCV